MVDSLEAELDRLFALPPAELVEARNALADQLRRAGDKAGAARIKTIKRAVPVAWALNQVHFTEPQLLERARQLTDELRALHGQPGVDTRRLAGAVEGQRAAMQAIVEAAMQAGRSAGLSETALQQRKVFTTLQAWLAGKGEEAPGRMTQELEASGFDAFAGMTVLAAVPSPATAVAPSAAPPAKRAAAVVTEDGAAIEAARRRAAELEQRAAAALEDVQKRAAEHASAEQARAQAEVSVREAERQLAELRSMLDQRARELERRAAALDEARGKHEQAEAAASAARSEAQARGLTPR